MTKTPAETPTTDPTGTRSEIMDAFAAQLASGGYTGISLVGVARSVGIRKPSIYHHFPGGKEELYQAVALRFTARLGDRIDAALNAAGGFERQLGELVAAVVDPDARSISFEQRVYDTLEQVSEEARSTVSDHYVRAVLDPVVALFTRAVGAGEVAGEPWFLTNAFLHLARSVDHSGGDEAAVAVVRLFLDGARPR